MIIVNHLQVAINNWNDGVKDEITRLVKQEGINSFKVSMADGNKMFKNDADMLDAFAACRQVGAVVGVHAELGAVIAENEKRLAARGVTGRSFLTRNAEVAGNSNVKT